MRQLHFEVSPADDRQSRIVSLSTWVAWVALAIALLAYSSARADTAPGVRTEVVTLVSTYLSRLRAGDYEAVSELIDPKGLQDVQSTLLPIMLQLAERDTVEAQTVSQAFFDGVPQAEWPAMSPRQCYAGMLGFVEVAAPQAIEQLAQVQFEVGEVKVNGDAGTVQLVFIGAGGQRLNDRQGLVRVDGRWRLKIRQDAGRVAAALQGLLQ